MPKKNQSSQGNRSSQNERSYPSNQTSQDNKTHESTYKNAYKNTHKNNRRPSESSSDSAQSQGHAHIHTLSCSHAIQSPAGHTHTHTHTHTYADTQTDTHTDAHTDARADAQTNINANTPLQASSDTHTRTDTNPNASLPTQSPSYDHSHIQSRDHTHTHSHSHAHNHNHSRSHSHGHSHTHGQALASRRRLSIALGITGTFFLTEVIGAAFSQSLALLADASHMAVDSLGLVVALIVSHLMTKERCNRRTWGWARAEVLGSTLQASILLILCGVILWEAINRFLSPTPVGGTLMVTLGVLGLIANIASLLVLVGGRKNSLNLRAAILEVTTDAFGSLAVIVAAVVYLLTGWMYADAVVSLLIAVLIVPRALIIMRESLKILLEETPPGLNLEQVREKLMQHPNVVLVHDLHVSTIGTGLVNLTAHIVVTEDTLDKLTYQTLMSDLQRSLKEDFPVSINHTTLQVDSEHMVARELLAH